MNTPARVNQAEFARIAGVNRSTITKWIANGRIEMDSDGLIDPEIGLRMRQATESPQPHHQARKAQIEEIKREAAQKRAGSAQGTNPHSPAQNTPSEAKNPIAEPVSTPGNSPATPVANPSVEKLGNALKLETWKLQKARAETANVELDRMAGALVERTEVDFVMADIGNIVRTQLESMPDRLASRIAAHRGDVNAIHRAIQDAAHDTLAAINETISRRAKGLDT